MKKLKEFGVRLEFPFHEGGLLLAKGRDVEDASSRFLKGHKSIKPEMIRNISEL